MLWKGHLSLWSQKLVQKRKMRITMAFQREHRKICLVWSCATFHFNTYFSKYIFEKLYFEYCRKSYQLFHEISNQLWKYNLGLKFLNTFSTKYTWKPSVFHKIFNSILNKENINLNYSLKHKFIHKFGHISGFEITFALLARKFV